MEAIYYGRRSVFVRSFKWAIIYSGHTDIYDVLHYNGLKDNIGHYHYTDKGSQCKRCGVSLRKKTRNKMLTLARIMSL